VVSPWPRKSSPFFYFYELLRGKTALDQRSGLRLLFLSLCGLYYTADSLAIPFFDTFVDFFLLFLGCHRVLQCPASPPTPRSPSLPFAIFFSPLSSSLSNSKRCYRSSQLALSFLSPVLFYKVSPEVGPQDPLVCDFVEVRTPVPQLGVRCVISRFLCLLTLFPDTSSFTCFFFHLVRKTGGAVLAVVFSFSFPLAIASNSFFRFLRGSSHPAEFFHSLSFLLSFRQSKHSTCFTWTFYASVFFVSFYAFWRSQRRQGVVMAPSPRQSFPASFCVSDLVRP